MSGRVTGPPFFFPFKPRAAGVRGRTKQGYTLNNNNKKKLPPPKAFEKCPRPRAAKVRDHRDAPFAHLMRITEEIKTQAARGISGGVGDRGARRGSCWNVGMAAGKVSERIGTMCAWNLALLSLELNLSMRTQLGTAHKKRKISMVITRAITRF